MPTDYQAARLIGAIHKAALDPIAWQVVAEEIDRVVGSGAVAIHSIDEMSRLTFPIAAEGFDPGYLDSYLNHYAAISPWPEKFLTMPKAKARHSTMDLPLEDYMRTEFYQDWMRPQEDRVASVGIRTAGNGPRSILATVNLRRRDRDRLEGPAFRLFNWLNPHLSHASAVNDVIARLSTQSFARRTQSGAAERGGIFIVSDERVLLWADPGAISVLGTLLGMTPLGRLTFFDAGAQNWFEGTVASLRRRGDSARTLSFSFHAGSKAHLWMIRAVPCDAVLPVAHVYSEMQYGRQTLALIVDQPERQPTTADRLRQGFGLTAAEAEVALKLAEGFGTDEIAAKRNASRNTVRNQIQTLLFKMDARSRGDVIRIVSRLLDNDGL